MMKKLRNNLAIAAAVAAMLAAGLQISAAPAQPRPDRAPARGPGQPAEPVAPDPRGPMVTVPCCRCIDGSIQTINLNTGAAPWQVQPPAGPSVAAVQVAGNLPGGWASMPPAKWIRHPGPNAVGDYVYTLRVFVPRCVIPASVVLTGEFAADNHATLQVNSTTVSTVATTGFVNPTTITPTPLVPGVVNIITVRLHNLHGATGFVLRGSVTRRCPREAVPMDSDPVEDK